MAKMKKPKKSKRIIGKVSRSLQTAKKTYDIARNPISGGVDAVLARWAKIDKTRRKGNIGKRSQCYNPRIRRWEKYNSVTGEKISTKQTPKPYKDIAKRKKPPIPKGKPKSYPKKSGRKK